MAPANKSKSNRSRSASRVKGEKGEISPEGKARQKGRDDKGYGLTVGVFLVLYVVLTTGLPAYLHSLKLGTFNPLQASLSFFLGLNSLICLWEIALGLHIGFIKSEYLRLQRLHGDDRLGAVMAFFNAPLSLTNAVSLKFWSLVWSTYSLYDPSYSNRESFGFFVDVSNGWCTLLPSLLFWASMTRNVLGLSARTLGCIGLVKFYVELHGTLVYFLSFIFNKRYEGKGTNEVALFVGISNGLWFFFPALGVATSLYMIFNNSFDIFGHV